MARWIIKQAVTDDRDPWNPSAEDLSRLVPSRTVAVLTTQEYARRMGMSPARLYVATSEWTSPLGYVMAGAWWIRDAVAGRTRRR